MSTVVFITAVLVFFAMAAGLSAYTFDPGDFAVEVIDYRPGSGIGVDTITSEPFNDPATALGRPTIDTTGDNTFAGPPTDVVTVVPVYQAFRSFEVVTVGDGGSLTLKFNRKVYDDPFNSYGLDVTVFGNASSNVQGDSAWTNGNPDGTIVGNSTISEPGMVEVSQDAEIWYAFSAGPFADEFPPTLGREFDFEKPVPGQLYWGQPTDPTLPLDPTVTEAAISGKSVTVVVQDFYGQSAGGISFDIGLLDLPVDPLTAVKWIQYIRVIDPEGSGSVEIDAVADAAPGDGPLLGDANNDGAVTGSDLIAVQQHFAIVEPDEVSGLLLGDADDNGAVSGADLLAVQQNFGRTLPGEDVPEPGAAALVFMALAIGVGRRRGRGEKGLACCEREVRRRL